MRLGGLTVQENNWLNKIHSSHGYFHRKMGYAPNLLIISHRMKRMLFAQVMDENRFTLCDIGISQFMGNQVWISENVKDFVWALAVEE